MRVRVERGVRWLVDQYRSQGARTLINRARSVAAHALAPPGPPPALPAKAVPQAAPVARPIAAQEWPQDELASMYAGIALRDLNLLDSLLARLETMEANEADPESLERLYRLDHLATRLRRNAENLRILAGLDVGSSAEEACSLVDVLRAAMSSIEQYTRVEIGRVTALAVVDFAADDVSRLLAELLDNATAQSPPTSVVTVSAHLTEQGSVLIRVEDSGIGLPPDRLRALNSRLSTNTRLDNESIEHMGLAVVRRLASRHGMRVALEPRPRHGTTASVLLPSSLLCEAPPTPWFTEVPIAGRHRAAQLTQPATPSTAPLPSRRSGPPSPTPRPDRTRPSTPTAAPAAPPSPPRPSVPGPTPASGPGSSPLPSRPVAADRQAPSPTGPGSPAPAATGQQTAVGQDEHPGATTTRNGLPRRVPKSLRDPEPAPQAQATAPSSAEQRAGREQFVADLGAFSDGEQAARNDSPGTPPSPAPAPGTGPRPHGDTPPEGSAR